MSGTCPVPKAHPHPKRTKQQPPRGAQFLGGELAGDLPDCTGSDLAVSDVAPKRNRFPAYHVTNHTSMIRSTNPFPCKPVALYRLINRAGLNLKPNNLLRRASDMEEGSGRWGSNVFLGHPSTGLRFEVEHRPQFLHSE